MSGGNLQTDPSLARIASGEQRAALPEHPAAPAARKNSPHEASVYVDVDNVHAFPATGGRDVNAGGQHEADGGKQAAGGRRQTAGAKADFVLLWARLSHFLMPNWSTTPPASCSCLPKVR